MPMFFLPEEYNRICKNYLTLIFIAPTAKNVMWPAVKIKFFSDYMSLSGTVIIIMVPHPLYSLGLENKKIHVNVTLKV